MGVVMVAVTLFWPAGTLAWPWAWALVALYAAWVLANGLIVGRRSPELLAERAARARDAKRWDVRLMSLMGLLTVAKYVIAGFDYRYGWSQGFAPWMQALALLAAAAGMALTTWGMAANAYFSQIVRIQQERGHTVVAGGPYRYVRHPAYLGTLLFELASPLLLGSWWALLAGALAAALFVLRTALEDRDLQAELPGYAEYAGRVRYRLLPGVW
jgi:protein-S-isoprenylcysteine O-methyltransferase Ste14